MCSEHLIRFLAFSGFGLIRHPTNEFWPTPTDNTRNPSRCLLSHASLASWQVAGQSGKTEQGNCHVYEAPLFKSVTLTLYSKSTYCRVDFFFNRSPSLMSHYMNKDDMALTQNPFCEGVIDPGSPQVSLDMG